MNIGDIKNLGKKRSGFVVVLIACVVLTLIFSYVFLFGEKREETDTDPKITVSDELTKFSIVIDKIDVVAPVIKNVDGRNEEVYMKELEGGVAHYEGTALPGENGNIFIFGHSSVVDGGLYDEIFSRIDELEIGDHIRIFYEEEEYQYTIFEKKVIAENNLSVLRPTEEEQLTVMTCWPIGSNEKRIVVKARLAL